MTHNHDAASNPEEIRVAEVLQQIRAGIRQRQAELAALGGSAISVEEKQMNQRLRDLQAESCVRAQPFASRMPVIGRLIVFVREMWCNVATRWYVHAILRQQNAFNQAVVEIFQELSETQNDIRRLLEQLEQRQGELETGAMTRPPDTLAHDQEVSE